MPTARRNGLVSMAQARAEITRLLGKDVIVPLEGNEYQSVSVIPTGAIMVDAALGVGGFPRGRVTELFGQPSSGKSSLSLSAASQAQAQGLRVLYLDYEHTYSKPFARTFGVNHDSEWFMLSQPDNFEQGVRLLELLCENDLIGLAIVDSLAAMATAKELEGDLGDTPPVAALARAMSQTLRRLVGTIASSGVAVVFINQMREEIGGYNPSGRRRWVTPGGRALQFYASARLEVSVKEAVKGKVRDVATGESIDGTVAVRVQAMVVKNKLGPPYRKGEFFLRDGEGLSERSMIADLAIKRGLIVQSGSRYQLPFTNPNTEKPYSIAGIAGVLKHFDVHPDQYALLEAKIRELIQTDAGLLEADEPRPVDQEAEAAEDTDEVVEELTRQSAAGVVMLGSDGEIEGLDS